MRRPERFSDTVSSAVPALDRAMLEYHLSTLTSRNEELLFEEFAKALLQRTVCPNLLPHTGPSGGGDSKVDSETYPVAPSLALSWYVGEPDKASTERWAFAFSAKEKWRPKVSSDVAFSSGLSWVRFIMSVSNTWMPILVNSNGVTGTGTTPTSSATPSLS